MFQQSVHTDRKDATCEFCGKVFLDRRQLESHHVLNHMDQKLHSCKTCGHGFSWKENLVRHMRSHVERPFGCVRCKMSFRQEDDLQNHQIQYHRTEIAKQSSMTNNGAPISKPAGPPFVCPFCKEKFRYSFSLEAHAKIHRNSLMVSGVAPQNMPQTLSGASIREASKTPLDLPFQCTHCQRSFKYKFSLEAHLKNHIIGKTNSSVSKKNECRRCGKRFRWALSLKAHLHEVHGYEYHNSTKTPRDKSDSVGENSEEEEEDEESDIDVTCPSVSSALSAARGSASLRREKVARAVDAELSDCLNIPVNPNGRFESKSSCTIKPLIAVASNAYHQVPASRPDEDADAVSLIASYAGTLNATQAVINDAERVLNDVGPALDATEDAGGNGEADEEVYEVETEVNDAEHEVDGADSMALNGAEQILGCTEHRTILGQPRMATVSNGGLVSCQQVLTPAPYANVQSTFTISASHLTHAFNGYAQPPPEMVHHQQVQMQHQQLLPHQQQVLSAPPHQQRIATSLLAPPGGSHLGPLSMGHAAGAQVLQVQGGMLGGEGAPLIIAPIGIPLVTPQFGGCAQFVASTPPIGSASACAVSPSTCAGMTAIVHHVPTAATSRAHHVGATDDVAEDRSGSRSIPETQQPEDDEDNSANASSEERPACVESVTLTGDRDVAAGGGACDDREAKDNSAGSVTLVVASSAEGALASSRVGESKLPERTKKQASVDDGGGSAKSFKRKTRQATNLERIQIRNAARLAGALHWKSQSEAGGGGSSGFGSEATFGDSIPSFSSLVDTTVAKPSPPSACAVSCVDPVLPPRKDPFRRVTRSSRSRRKRLPVAHSNVELRPAKFKLPDNLAELTTGSTLCPLCGLSFRTTESLAQHKTFCRN